MSIFQSITPNDITITPFQAYKSYTITNDTTSSFGVNVLIGQYDANHYNLADIHDPIVPTLSQSNGYYEYLIFNSIYNNHYKDYYTAPYSLLDIPFLKEKKIIGNSIFSYSIPQLIYGEKIKEGTLSLTSGSLNIIDDSFGNLIELTTSQSMSPYYEKFNNNCIGDWNCRDIFVNNNQSYDYSSYHQTMIHSNVSSVKTLESFNTPYYNGSAMSRIYHAPQYELHNDDFMISFNFIPGDQINSSSVLICKDGIKRATNLRDDEIAHQPYPFKIEYVIYDSTNCYLSCSIFDGTTKYDIVSNFFNINDDPRYFVALSKSGSQYLFTSYDLTNSILSQPTLTIDHPLIINDCDIVLGMNPDTTNAFVGEIYNLKISSTPLTVTEITNIALQQEKHVYDYYVGNVFYNTGNIVITDQSPSVFNLTGSFDLSFKSTKTIHEYEIMCTIPAGELNYTMNPSSLENQYSSKCQDYAGFVSSSEWSPYVTTIGLYNDNLDLLIAAKVNRPVKQPNDIDITYVIKFDI